MLVFNHSGIQVYHADCATVMAQLAPGSIDAIITDPPYNGVLDDAWDNQWASNAEFVNWLPLSEWQRLLAHNGALFVFCWSTRAAQVELAIAAYFNVLNHIVWDKASGGVASKSNKEELRSFLRLSERIIFAEQHHSDQRAQHASDHLRGFVFEPLRAYLDGEKKRAGVTSAQVDAYLGNFMSGHYFGSSQWHLPTPENYQKLRELFNPHLAREYEHLAREYEDLRQEYEDLRQEYEDLRRPFNLTARDQYGDVWRFNTSFNEGTYHPAQKPLALMQHMVRITTRPQAIILDPFAGSGTTAIAALRHHRRCIVIEQDAAYVDIIIHRLEAELRQPRLL